jgi:hypothetical protein
MLHNRKYMPACKYQGESVENVPIDAAQPGSEAATTQLLFDHYRLAPVLGQHRCWLRCR